MKDKEFTFTFLVEDNIICQRIWNVDYDTVFNDDYFNKTNGLIYNHLISWKKHQMNKNIESKYTIRYECDGEIFECKFLEYVIYNINIRPILVDIKNYLNLRKNEDSPFSNCDGR